MPHDWNEYLETGYEEIDKQHKELFARVHKYVRAISEERGDEEIDQLFKFLKDYVTFHFSTEEALLASKNYPELPKHHSQHKYFLTRFQELYREYETGRVTDHLKQSLHREVVGWLMNHVAKTDKEWVNYFIEQQSPRAGVSELRRCPKCGKQAHEGKFCNFCGANLDEKLCPKCGAKAEGKFCGVCGAQLAANVRCPDCGSQLSPDAKFCTGCGRKI